MNQMQPLLRFAIFCLRIGPVRITFSENGGKWRGATVSSNGKAPRSSRLSSCYYKKSGPEIVGQLFNFTDKGEREVALRPELTPSLARVVAAHDREFRKPISGFRSRIAFVTRNSSAAGSESIYQFNADLIGEASLEADIELVALCIDLLRTFGFGAQDVVVRISDREFWIDFLRQEKVAEEKWQETLQIIDKSERESREKTAEKLGPLSEPVFAILDGKGSSEKLDRVLEALRMRGLADFAQINLGIVRGLAYYTGIVFEAFDRGGKLRALAGGGRYDNLIHQLSDGALSLPAIGFAMGDVVLAELIEEIPAAKAQLTAAISSQRELDLYAVIAKEERRADTMVQVQSPREPLSRRLSIRAGEGWQTISDRRATRGADRRPLRR
jgi:histidyl-tRNA synthetase